MSFSRNFQYIAIGTLVYFNIVIIYGQQDMLSIFNRCKDESNATNDDIETFKNQQIPTTSTGKCLLSCMFHDSGLMSDDQYDIKGAHLLASKVYQNDPVKMAKAKQVNEACAKELKSFDGDKCEIAAFVANCTMRASAKFGLV
uniref:Uncharacterized protein n=1 Tax=Clastoptera arizonana TaxID=38151 RepID=A0A1B6DFI3_9HEMI